MSDADAFAFACPSCNAPGKARVDWAGRSVRCKHCKAIFEVPTPGEAAADAYALAITEEDTPPPDPLRSANASESGGSTFSPGFRDAPLREPPRDRPRPRPKTEEDRRREIQGWTEDRRVRILAGLAIFGALLAVVTFAIPSLRMVGGGVLIGLGFLLTAVGFFVGAYAAFCEDLLYGMAYLFIPIYTGYYLVTRFDDLWPYFSASTIGFVLFLAGSKAVELSGAI